ncbi:dTMP kinase [Cohnella sp. GCM10027633]|uniref:dTMP kinase n=1 Tax=unclassified Cohnella TaxID=2636738 RepID=UPI00363B3748
MRKGYFITIEGNEGAGKSTIVTKAVEYLESKGIDVVASREPGGSEIAEQIRSIILDVRNTKMDGRTEALLYAAARRQHYVEKIVPTLEAGRTMICDRFIDSSLAYQGHARGLGIDEILGINEFAIEGTYPDLTLYLEVEPKLGIARINANKNREVNRLDVEPSAFHEKVREGYQEVVRRFPERIAIIDANGTVDDVFRQVKHALDRFVGSSGIA